MQRFLERSIKAKSFLHKLESALGYRIEATLMPDEYRGSMATGVTMLQGRWYLLVNPNFTNLSLGDYWHEMSHIQIWLEGWAWYEANQRIPNYMELGGIGSTVMSMVQDVEVRRRVTLAGYENMQEVTLHDSAPFCQVQRGICTNSLFHWLPEHLRNKAIPLQIANLLLVSMKPSLKQETLGNLSEWWPIYLEPVNQIASLFGEPPSVSLENYEGTVRQILEIVELPADSLLPIRCDTAD